MKTKKAQRIKSRYDNVCKTCKRKVYKGWQVWWVPGSKEVECTVCMGREARINAQRRFAINNPYGGMRS